MLLFPPCIGEILVTPPEPVSVTSIPPSTVTGAAQPQMVIPPCVIGANSGTGASRRTLDRERVPTPTVRGGRQNYSYLRNVAGGPCSDLSTRIGVRADHTVPTSSAATGPSALNDENAPPSNIAKGGVMGRSRQKRSKGPVTPHAIKSIPQVCYHR